MTETLELRDAKGSRLRITQRERHVVIMISQKGDTDNYFYATPEQRARIGCGEWKPIAECPDNTSVWFGWSGTGQVERGCVEHNAERMGGYRKDYFWGGEWTIEADDNPPDYFLLERPLPPLPPPPSTALGDKTNGSD